MGPESGPQKSRKNCFFFKFSCPFFGPGPRQPEHRLRRGAASEAASQQASQATKPSKPGNPSTPSQASKPSKAKRAKLAKRAKRAKRAGHKRKAGTGNQQQRDNVRGKKAGATEQSAPKARHERTAVSET